MNNSSEAVACACARAADERKAENIVVLQVGQMTFIADYFVIATGRNERQIRAIAQEIEGRMKSLGRPIVGMEGTAQSGWLLIDLADTIVHLFSREARELYDLELLWGQAPRVQWERVSPAAPRRQ